MTAASTWRNIFLVIAIAASVVAGVPAATADDIEQHAFRIPGTDYDVVVDASEQRPSTALSQPLLAAIAVWLSKEFDLPAIHRYPDIEVVSSSAITTLRYKGLLPHAPHEVARDARPATPQTTETVAIYSDHAQTIYLAEGWTGRTWADLSVLVHEMAHHFQNILSLKHACPQERERLAYEAQDRWLRLFGHSLETDFELDGFSLLGKTRCFY
jgi:hypothetical protein